VSFNSSYTYKGDCCGKISLVTRKKKEKGTESSVCNSTPRMPTHPHLDNKRNWIAKAWRYPWQSWEKARGWRPKVIRLNWTISKLRLIPHISPTQVPPPAGLEDVQIYKRATKVIVWLGPEAQNGNETLVNTFQLTTYLISLFHIAGACNYARKKTQCYSKGRLVSPTTETRTIILDYLA